MMLGSVQVLYKLILLMGLWGVGGQRENTYVKDLNSYPPEEGS